MLHALPIRNVRLSPCHEDWQQMTPTAQGRSCRSCQREVIDFTGATTADLAAARAAALDGQVCGRFRRGQLAGVQPARFGLWARAFVLALALLFGQGLTARQAWAQARPPAPTKAKARPRQQAAKPRKPKPLPPSVQEEIVYSTGIVVDYPINPAADTTADGVYNYVEQMPLPPGGMEQLQRYFSAHIRYPEQVRRERVEGKVFVSVVVGPDGQLSKPQLLKGIGAGCDEEALRVVGRMPAWTPGRQNGRVVPVRYTLPVVFTLPAAQVQGPSRQSAPKTITRPQAIEASEFQGDLGELPPQPEPPVKAPPYQYVERVPTPPGGQEAYRQAMRKQLRRPAGPRLPGKVFVQLDGRLTDLKVSQGLSPAYDAEALRVVQQLQPWTPGHLNGRAVPMGFTQVVVFGKPK